MRFLVGDVDWMHAHITVNGREITIDDAWEGSEPVGPVAGDCVNSYFAFKSGVSGLYDSRKNQFGRGGTEILGRRGRLITRRGAEFGDDLSGVRAGRRAMSRKSGNLWKSAIRPRLRVTG